jgi:hypothetical protein
MRSGSALEGQNRPSQNGTRAWGRLHFGRRSRACKSNAASHAHRTTCSSISRWASRKAARFCSCESSLARDKQSTACTSGCSLTETTRSVSARFFDTARSSSWTRTSIWSSAHALITSSSVPPQRTLTWCASTPGGKSIRRTVEFPCPADPTRRRSHPRILPGHPDSGFFETP